ncbi:hypothetical protein GCM10023115_38770 [Pontixanthobacter gangjinensis]
MMNGDGSELDQLTKSEFEEWSPVWITEDQISFLRQKDEISRIRLKISTGEEWEIPQPKNCSLDDKNVLYSPTSNLQLYSCQKDISLYDPEKDETTNLTEELEGTSRYQSWNYDGKKLIFTNNARGNNDVYQLNLETKSLSLLTNFDSNDERGEISPDGRLLVFSSDKFEAKNQDILIMDLHSGKLTNITNSAATELIARFSADGNNIYFGSNMDGNWEIYSYNLKTKRTSRLTQDNAFDGDPRIFKK